MSEEPRPRRRSDTCLVSGPSVKATPCKHEVQPHGGPSPVSACPSCCSRCSRGAALPDPARRRGCGGGPCPQIPRRKATPPRQVQGRDGARQDEERSSPPPEGPPSTRPG